MRVKWLVALAVILSFIWIGPAVAGSARPVGGDPDIWERAKVNNPNVVPTPIQLQENTSVVVDFGLFRTSISRQDASKTNIKTCVSPLAVRPSLRRR